MNNSKNNAAGSSNETIRLELKNYQITETEYSGYPVRTVVIDGSPRYFAEDVARAYGFASLDDFMFENPTAAEQIMAIEFF